MVKAFIHRSGGIDWYCEQRGAGPHVVLIPSGEGDCASFEKLAVRLASDFTVLTFDTPGFSRSIADPADISAERLAGQIATLITSLGIKKASFYGCSSGGVAALDLAVHHAGIVHNVIVHEAAIAQSADNGPGASLRRLAQLDDAAIATACAELYENVMNEDPAAWRALGSDYHARLAINYVTWVRYYVSGHDRFNPFSPADLADRPIDWTIGGLSPAFAFLTNVTLATRAGIEIGVLMCKHFPQVSIPEYLADHIRASMASRTAI